MPQTIITLPAGTALLDGRTLDAPLEIPLPYQKVGLMGRPGGGKSKLAASFPKPMLVLASDPLEKLQPYYDRGIAREATRGAFGQPLQIIDSAITKKPIIQIESYEDDNPKTPQAMSAFESRCESIREDVIRLGLSTVVIDSWSAFEDIAVWRRRFGAMAVKDPTEFGRDRGAAKDDIWPIFVSRLFKCQCNVVFIFHTTEKPQAGEGGGAGIYGIKAIGQLPTELARMLPERWRCEAQPDGVKRVVYTRPDGRFDLTTLIDAPSPCDNEYAAVWSNYLIKRATLLTQPSPNPTA